jgi:hypothetical protein
MFISHHPYTNFSHMHNQYQWNLQKYGQNVNIWPAFLLTPSRILPKCCLALHFQAFLGFSILTYTQWPWYLWNYGQKVQIWLAFSLSPAPPMIWLKCQHAFSTFHLGLPHIHSVDVMCEIMIHMAKNCHRFICPQHMLTTHTPIFSHIHH